MFAIITPTMKYLIALRKSKYGYDVHVPSLPGCHSQGHTKKEALRHIEDAVLTYLDMTRQELKYTEFQELNVAVA